MFWTSDIFSAILVRKGPKLLFLCYVTKIATF